MAKQEIPFELLDILDPIVKNSKEKANFSYFLMSGKSEITFKSNIPNSKFYFKINYKAEKSQQSSKNVYAVSFYPLNENNLKEHTNIFAVSVIKEVFTTWTNCLDKYENSKTFLDDPIIESYQKDIFINILNFVEEHDDNKPYPLSSQTQFVDYLDNLLEIITTEIDSTENEEDKQNLNNSIRLIENIKENINKLTKGEIKQKFSLSLAYIAKVSLKFFNSITFEILKDVAVKAITGS